MQLLGLRPSPNLSMLVQKKSPKGVAVYIPGVYTENMETKTITQIDGQAVVMVRSEGSYTLVADGRAVAVQNDNRDYSAVVVIKWDATAPLRTIKRATREAAEKDARGLAKRNFLAVEVLDIADAR